MLCVIVPNILLVFCRYGEVEAHLAVGVASVDDPLHEMFVYRCPQARAVSVKGDECLGKMGIACQHLVYEGTLLLGLHTRHHLVVKGEKGRVAIVGLFLALPVLIGKETVKHPRGSARSGYKLAAQAFVFAVTAAVFLLLPRGDLL